jgi:hypothetical protein
VPPRIWPTDAAQPVAIAVVVQEGWPEGLMELRPRAPVHSDIRILFAVEPPATAMLIAVLEGPEVAESQFPEAVTASAGMLQRVRAGQAPEATTQGYDNSRSFLEEYWWSVLIRPMRYSSARIVAQGRPTSRRRHPETTPSQRWPWTHGHQPRLPRASSYGVRYASGCALGRTRKWSAVRGAPGPD